MRSAGAWLMGLALLAHAVGAAGAEALPENPASVASAGSPRMVVVMALDGAIGPAAAEYIHRGLQMAAAEKARLAVLQLDTPGGLDSSMRAIIKDILASPVPVATFVSPGGARAASAGTYILYASHIAAMTPASNLGAATPVAIGPSGEEDKAPGPERAAGGTLGAKRVSDASAYIRSLAQLRGRNADWAEQAVRESLSLSAPEALKQNVVTLVAQDLSDLLLQVNGREVQTADGSVRLATQRAQLLIFEPDWRVRLLSFITQPGLALVLLMVGICGLLLEFSSPGIVLPGVVGAICLTLALFGLQMLPVNYAGLGLVLLGAAFLVAEAFVPSFGVLGLGGIAAFAIGSVLLIDGNAPGFTVPLWLIAVLATFSAAVLLAVAGMAARARRRPVVSGVSTLEGAEGELLEFSGGEGWAQIQGDYWRVTGSAELEPGRRIRVTQVKGVVLQVAADGQPQRSGIGA